MKSNPAFDNTANVAPSQNRSEKPKISVDFGAEATNPAIRAARFDSQVTPKGAPLNPLYQDVPDDHETGQELYNDD